MRIDMHSHILPKADHGSDSLECSLKQVEKAKSKGIDVILATPHYYRHRDNIKDFLARREHCYNKLTAALKEKDIDIRIMKGAEVTLEVDLINDDYLSQLCIEGSNCLLLEMPSAKWTDWTYNAVYEIGVRHKVTPIIAHIDRYEEKQTKKLLEMGVRAQVNAVSICNIFTRRRIMNYLNRGQAEFLGSDVHNASAPQYDFYEKALKIMGREMEGELMQNAAEVLGLAEKKKAAASEGLILF
ncbi:MAG: hypothetical protein IJC50_04320 [Clostridia bacterium]|nr:hypothetical protein [Clostridia bacterium]